MTCFLLLLTLKSHFLMLSTFLTDKQWDLVMAESKKPQISVYYEAYLINDDNEANSKLVYIYLTPKVFSLRSLIFLLFVDFELRFSGWDLGRLQDTKSNNTNQSAQCPFTCQYNVDKQFSWLPLAS